MIFSLRFSTWRLFLVLLFCPFTGLQAQFLDTTLARQYLDSAKVMLDSLQYDQALSYRQKALNIFRHTLGEQDTSTANTYALIGSVWERKRSYQKALENYQKALNIRTAVLGEMHSRVAQSFHSLGMIYRFSGKWEEALAHHQKALSIRQSIFEEEDPLIAASYYEIGVAYDYIGDLDKGLKYYQKALKGFLAAYGDKHPSVALAYNGIGVIYDYKSDYDKALLYLKEALNTMSEYGDRHSISADINNNIGIIYRIKADYRKALHFHQRALQARLSILGDKHPAVATSCSNLASVYKSTGEFGKALEYDRKALEIRLKAYGESHFRVASSYGSIGGNYRGKGDLDKAIAFTEKALQINKKTAGEDHYRVANNYINLGAFYNEKGELDEALEYYQKALSIYQAVFGEENTNLTTIYHNISNTYKDKGEFDKALTYHQKALEIQKALLGEKHPSVATSFKGIGVIHSNKDRFDEALGFLNKALDIRLAFFGTEHPDVAEIYYVISQVYFLKKEYQTAIEYNEKAVTALDGMRKNHISSEAKQVQLSRHYDIYEHAIQTFAKAVDSLPRQFDINETFIYAEKAKSKLLLESINTSKAAFKAGIPDSLLQKEYDLRVELAYYQKKQFEERQKGISKNDSLLNIYNNKLLVYREDYEALIRRFEREYPAYYNLKHSAKVVSVAEVQKTLEDDQALIEYFLGDSTIYAFVITKDDFKLKSINRDFPLKQWVEDFHNGLYGYHYSQTQERTEQLFNEYNDLFIDNAFKLYDKLIRPLGDLPPKLIIIPDDLLSYLPFEILLSKQPEENYRFKIHPYLGRRHQISYNFSATLWQEMRDKKHQTSGLLALAPSFEENEQAYSTIAELRRNGLGPLRFNTLEVENIGRLSGGKLFIGEEATSDIFSRFAPDYSILHLATHAKLDDQDADYSFLAFSKSKDSLGNEKLFIRDLYNLHLPADMVVLSACETGLGDVRRGEGVISLARGFAYEGAKSIVTSLWSVNDHSTAEIMELFYKNIRSGMSKDQALQQAKFTYLDQQKELLAAHPFYWAAFVAVGDMTPITLKTNMSWMWLGGGLLSLAVAGLFWWKKRIQ